MDDLPRHDLELPGCTPEPLMAYLKALGILRLVAEQKDPDARGWWKNDIFWLRSPLDRDALVSFFLEEYDPTPIVAPWAGGSGFFKKDNKKAVEALCSTNVLRCKAYADVIHQVRRIIKGENLGDKPQDEEKARLIRQYRRELPDEVVAWMDAAMVLQQDGQGFAPLLGTGGNDGRLDFTQNFMQRIVSLGLHNDAGNQESEAWLKQALFAAPARLGSASVGQFAPGRAGGPNATQGMEGNAADNPWDFILMMEGALLLAGAAVRRFGIADSARDRHRQGGGHRRKAVRRFGIADSARAAFPFTVRTVAAGFDSPASKDEAESRGELWLPLWTRPTSAAELRQLFGEGRAEVSGRAARDGADFARAVAGLGVDRGIAAFNRLGFLKRSGKAFLAAPLGRFEVVARTGVDLLREVDPWLERFRRAAGDKNAPPRFGSALRRIDSGIFDFCKYGGAAFFQKIVVALGAAERELANAERFREDKKLKPLARLSADWVKAARAPDNGEFDIALALAGVRHDPDKRGEQPKIGPLRANLEPVDWKNRCRKWAGDKEAKTKDRSVVWNAADLATNLANVLQRRMMDGARAGCERLPLGSQFAAPLDAVAAFIAGDLDDRRIEELIWGLMLVDQRSDAEHTRQKTQAAEADTAAPLPRDYALLKLLFLPGPLVPQRAGESVAWRLARRLAGGNMESGLTIRPEPRILPLLRAGRLGEACRIAAQRLRVSGLSPMPGPVPGRPTGVMRDNEWDDQCRDRQGADGSSSEEPLPYGRGSERSGSDSARYRYAQRLAAALLIPVSSKSVNELVHLVCRADDSAAPDAVAVSAEGGTE